MPVLERLWRYLSTHFFTHKETLPEKAYDLWSASYDQQPDNLMLALDESIFSQLINNISIENTVILDIGCGTGRHWDTILVKKPQKLIGFDVSEGMLKILREKFPHAESYRSSGHQLDRINDSSCDLIISTLAVAHIENLEEAFYEWNRVLKTGGDIIITDYHPEALAKGAERTFCHNNKIISVKNHIHALEKIRALGRRLNWRETSFKERHIDDSVRHYYEKKQALAVFERFSGLPVIYGIQLRKNDAVA